MLNYEELISERLVLRLPIIEDFKCHYEYLSNPENYPYADYKIAKSEENIEEFFTKVFKEQLISALFWMIADKKTNKSMGTISAWNINWDEMTIEFGYSLYPEYRGKGYMKEALTKVIEYLKAENNFYTFDIWTDIRNKSSIKLAKALNFKYLGNEVEKAHHSDTEITYATFRLDARKDRN